MQSWQSWMVLFYLFYIFVNGQDQTQNQLLGTLIKVGLQVINYFSKLKSKNKNTLFCVTIHYSSVVIFSHLKSKSRKNSYCLLQNNTKNWIRPYSRVVSSNFFLISWNKEDMPVFVKSFFFCKNFKPWISYFLTLILRL